jgi:hypothetical protein
MKRMILAAAAAAGLAMSARADFGGPAVPSQGSSQPMTPAEYRIQQDRYGLLPMLRKVVWWKPTAPAPGTPTAGVPHHPTTGHVPGMAGPMMGHPGMYGPGMGYPGMAGQPQGTLVFPHHPFARSPRDYFMWEPGRR